MTEDRPQVTIQPDPVAVINRAKGENNPLVTAILEKHEKQSLLDQLIPLFRQQSDELAQQRQTIESLEAALNARTEDAKLKVAT